MLKCCGRISVSDEAEKVAVSPRPRSRHRHGKRLNRYSTCGLEKFESVSAELSAKREHIANKTGVPEAMVRFVSSEKGWIPVVIGARDQGTSGGDAARLSILGPAQNNNGEMGGELRRKDEGNDTNDESERRGLAVSASTSHVRTHGDPTESWATAFLRAVNPESIDPEHNHHHQSAAKMFRRFVSMDNWPSTRPASPVHGSDTFYRKTRPAVAYDASVGALTAMIILLFCFAILFTGAWLYLVNKVQKG